MINQEDKADVLFIDGIYNVIESELESKWVIDSCCSFHMTWRKELFTTLDQIATGIVRMANDIVETVKGIGSVKIVNEDDSMVILTKVRYIPEVRRNLISLGTLETLGCSFRSGNVCMVILRNNRVVLWGK